MAATKIPPVVGRIVHLIVPSTSSGIRVRIGEPLAAQIAAVNADGTINIGFLDATGMPGNLENVRLVQEGDTEPAGDYCRWMPYQIGQAKKEEVHVVPPTAAPAPAAPKAAAAPAAKAVAKSVVRRK